MLRSIIGAAMGLSLIGIAASANAAPMFTTGIGSAVSSADRSATFDSVTDGQDLSNYSEDGLRLAKPGDALCQPGSGCHFIFTGRYGFSGGHMYTDLSGILSIGTTDASKIVGLELLLGSGSISGDTTGYWEIYSNSILVGSGSIPQFAFPQVIGFSDPSGFDELRIGMTSSATPPPTSFNFDNVVAVDNVTAQLSSIVQVPEPATLTLFTLGLVGLGFTAFRRRRTQSFEISELAAANRRLRG